MHSMSQPVATLDRSFFDRSMLDVARELIGTTLLVDGVGGIIVETEKRSDDECDQLFGSGLLRNGEPRCTNRQGASTPLVMPMRVPVATS